MTLDKQQQNVVMWAGIGVVGAFILYFAVLNPLYFAPLAATKHSIEIQQKTAITNKQTLETAAADNLKWVAMGIPTDSSTMEKNLRDTVLAAAGRNYGNFDISKWTAAGSRPYSAPKTPGRLDLKTDFVELRFTANATTSIAHLRRFLEYLEALKMPAKIDGIKIVSRKSGTDDLNIEVSLSALIYSPKVSIDPFQPTTVAATTGSSMAGPLGLVGGPVPVPAVGRGAVATPTAAPGTVDPALPPGATMEERLLQRRRLQLQDGPETSTTTSPK